MNIFLDSSFIVALVHRHDISHLAAKKLFDIYSNDSYFIDDIIKYESINIILKKADIKTAKFLNSWMKEDGLKTIPINQNIWDIAFNSILIKYSKSGPNIFDHIHFACMTEYHLQDVLTFDKHFSAAGFNVLSG